MEIEVGNKGFFKSPASRCRVARTDNERVLLLLTGDDNLVDIVCQQVTVPWKVVHQSAGYAASEVFAYPKIRLVILDDECLPDEDCGLLLNRIRRHAPSASLIYITNHHSEAMEKFARCGGAKYYAAQPLSAELFSHVLQSFLRSHR